MIFLSKLTFAEVSEPGGGLITSAARQWDGLCISVALLHRGFGKPASCGLARAARLFDHPCGRGCERFATYWNLCKASTCAGNGLDDSEESDR